MVLWSDLIPEKFFRETPKSMMKIINVSHATAKSHWVVETTRWGVSRAGFDGRTFNPPGTVSPGSDSISPINRTG